MVNRLRIIPMTSTMKFMIMIELQHKSTRCSKKRVQGMFTSIKAISMTPHPIITVHNERYLQNYCRCTNKLLIYIDKK